jgi:hypothetical protein
MVRCANVRTFFFIALALTMAGCSPPPPQHPKLTPMTANELLRFNTRAQNWIQFVKKQNPACEYRLELPDQNAHPDWVEVDHIVSCGGNNRMAAFDASVEFQYNKTTKRWEISRFGS